MPAPRTPVARPPRGSTIELAALASSAGGLKALTRILSRLPGDLPVPIVLVQHLDPSHPSMLAEILGRRTALRVKEAEADERIRPGTVYVAPPGHHLAIRPGGIVELSRSKPVRFQRPSADVLFESVAASYGEHAIAVVLTGAGTDGARGVQEIRKQGGTVVVQDEASSEFTGMPRAAIGTGDAQFVLPLEEIAPKLVELIGTKESL